MWTTGHLKWLYCKSAEGFVFGEDVPFLQRFGEEIEKEEGLAWGWLSQVLPAKAPLINEGLSVV